MPLVLKCVGCPTDVMEWSFDDDDTWSLVLYLKCSHSSVLHALSTLHANHRSEPAPPTSAGMIVPESGQMRWSCIARCFACRCEPEAAGGTCCLDRLRSRLVVRSHSATVLCTPVLHNGQPVVLGDSDSLIDARPREHTSAAARAMRTEETSGGLRYNDIIVLLLYKKNGL
jgi:hypothetical protein